MEEEKRKRKFGFCGHLEDMFFRCLFCLEVVPYEIYHKKYRDLDCLCASVALVYLIVSPIFPRLHLLI
jgi:hypothetical protein